MPGLYKSSLQYSFIITIYAMQGLYNSSLQYNFDFTIYAGSVQEFIAVQFHLYYICRVFTRVHCSTISSLLHLPGLYNSSLHYNFGFTIYAGSLQEFIAVQFCLSLLTRPACTTIRDGIFKKWNFCKRNFILYFQSFFPYILYSCIYAL